MLGLLIREKPNLEHFCGAPFVLSSCGHCYSPGAMNMSSIKWEGSWHAIFCFMHLQRRSFRGSLTLLYSDFRVVAAICPDLCRFLQCSHDPGCSYPQPLIIWSKMPRVGAQPPKRSRPCAMWSSEDMLREGGQTISLHSFILFPMPPNANPGLSMGHFGIVWATCMIPKCHHYKMAGLNLSTHHEILLGWNCLESWEFNPVTSFILGWRVEASHFIVSGFGKLCK